MAELDSRAYRPCVKCGAADRRPSGGCKACARASRAADKAANPEKFKAWRATYYASNRNKEHAYSADYRLANPDAHKAWRAANPGRGSALKAAWREANPERTRATDAARLAANPGLSRIYTQNRKARERANGGTLSPGLAGKLFRLQKGKCACCGQPLGDKYHMDHILPILLGGPNEDWNIQLLRQRCNQQKHAKHPVDFMQSRGFLI